MQIPDWLSEEEPDFSRFVRYENTVTADEGMEYVPVITDAQEGVEVFVNGESLGSQAVAERSDSIFERGTLYENNKLQSGPYQ